MQVGVTDSLDSVLKELVDKKETKTKGGRRGGGHENQYTFKT